MDATQKEKIYVAIGDDAQDGFNTLNWALKKWNSYPISIVILHVTHNISKDYVYTPCKFGFWISFLFLCLY
jgi:hypothetical protein